MLRMFSTRLFLSAIVPALLYMTGAAQAQNLSGGTPATRSEVRSGLERSGGTNGETIDKAKVAEEIKKEFLFCWDSYKKYAWGHDELDPITKKGTDWYSVPFYMMPVDAMDTMILMGLKKEADEDREFVETHLNFDQDVFVSNFEFTIRFVGGLLSSYELTGDRKLLDLAVDLANRELPAYKSPTGMPYSAVNLKTGAVKGAVNNPAGIGTMLVEFGTLTKLTGDTVYYNTAKRALLKLYSLQSGIGLVGDKINVETGQWVGTDCSVSGRIDSYYEYLIKSAILFHDKDCRRMWNSSIAAINKYLYDSTSTGVWYGHADMYTGKRTATMFGSLDAFFPGTLCLAGEVHRAAEVEESWYKVWKKYGIEPEDFDYGTMTIKDPGYYLRPEIMESAYYLYNYTGDPHYLAMQKTYFDDLVKYCKTDCGFVQLKNVATHEKGQGMPSYFLAETMKYLYLTFAPPGTLDFNKVIFNTEAHPMQRDWKAR